MLYNISDRVGWRDRKETIVIVDLQVGQVSTLENAARMIWLGIVEGLYAEDIAARVSARYNLPREEAQNHVREFIEELLLEGWISEFGAPE